MSDETSRVTRVRDLSDHMEELMHAQTGRLIELERRTTATDAGLRSLHDIMKGLQHELRALGDEIRETRERSRPNVNAYFIGAIAMISLLITVGSLAFVPVYRDLDTQRNQIDTLIENQQRQLDATLTNDRLIRNDMRHLNERAQDQYIEAVGDIRARIRELEHGMGFLEGKAANNGHRQGEK